MKSIVLIISIFFTLSTFAIDFCEGTSQKYFSRAEQKGADVLVTLANEDFRRYRNIGDWRISGKEISTVLIQSLTLEEFMKTPNQAADVFATLVLGRRDFDGEYDMAWSYGEDFFRALKCQ